MAVNITPVIYISLLIPAHKTFARILGFWQPFVSIRVFQEEDELTEARRSSFTLLSVKVKFSVVFGSILDYFLGS